MVRMHSRGGSGASVVDQEQRQLLPKCDYRHGDHPGGVPVAKEKLRMSGAPTNPTPFGERIAGKWQIPAVILSVLLLGAVLLTTKSPDRKLSIEAHLDRIVRMIDQRMYVQARQVAERLLRWPELTDEKRGLLKLQIARAAYGQAERNLDDTKSGARRLIALYDEAVDLGARLTGRDHRRLALLSERIDDALAAVRHYERARDKLHGPDLADRRRIIELSEYPLQVPAARVASMLDSFISDADDALGDLVWALGRRLEMLSTDAGWQSADALLNRYAPRFEGTDYAPQFDYLTALALWGSKRYDQAERRLRDLLARVTVSDPVYSKAGWLLGRVVMFDGKPQRPQEAVAIFRDVISARADRYYVTASRVGLAEALAYLQRHREALEAYRSAIEDMASTRGRWLVNPDTVRASLTVVGDERRRADDPQTALAYMQLAMSLVPADDDALRGAYLGRIGDLQAVVGRSYLRRAAQATDETEAKRMRDAATQFLEEAGESYFALASINTLNESLASRAMWSAAGMFDDAGRDERAIEVLRTYLTERPDSPVIPKLLLHLGRALKRVGRCAEAVEVFQRAYSTYPRSIHANAALIPLAECLMAMGPDHADQAEQALLKITEDSDIYTPAAPEYREALLLLGQLYSRQNRFEDAIVVLEEFLAGDPRSERMVPALFAIAEAYRESAMAIKAELLDPQFSGDAGRLAGERIARLQSADRMYAAMLDRIGREQTGGDADESVLERTYRREAVLNRAWTLFELGRYEDALRIYEQAAWSYKQSPAGLGAYVQVINCHIFLGQKQQARLALRRAKYLVDSIPDDAFGVAGGLETRADWRRYFDWVGAVLSEKSTAGVASGAKS